MARMCRSDAERPKLVTALVTATAALLTILNLPGWLPGAKVLLGHQVIDPCE